ncbi:MAG TPA: glycosyltransferase [Lacunisphaera sp.]|nr:glycosyltransferase [Lacunisphaera sp.]
MQESARCFHNLEWPAPGARLAGPVIWLRGWVVGKPGHDCIDLRVRHRGQTHLGVLGLPRTDLAAHFKARRPWLPAEFILGVPLPDGLATLTLEVMDAHGGWHELLPFSLTVALDGVPPPRVEGRLETRADGTWTVRDAHHPFHGHLDDPGPTPLLRHGRAPVFGWLLDETRPLAAVLATTDTLVFNHLDHGRTDEALAVKVPQHAAARHARLRGAVDFPATLIQPACLRVYAVSPDGSVHLCFAQRISPALSVVSPVTSAPAPYPAIMHQSLPELPSGRPHRLLLVTRSLLPNDATLRALDLARHLTSTHRWAARLVSAEDGPLRRQFEACGVESLVVDPGPLFAARDPAAMDHALHDLERQIWWKHLDAVAVFDPVCGWAITLARRQGIPVLFDCVTAEPLEPDPTAIPAVQSLLREGWRSATGLCFSSAAAARAQHGQLGDRPAEIIAHWHSPELPAPEPGGGPRVALAPLRTADWLARHHPAVAARWIFRQGPAGRIDDERLARQDDTFNSPRLQHTDDWAVHGVGLCLGPLFARGPLRPVIDAAAAGIPVVAPRFALTEEIFQGTRIQLVDEANPLALAHALLAWEALPASFQRDAPALPFRARHDPARLLPQWERLLETVARGHG